jgi:PAS domain S-box-containing protein
MRCKIERISIMDAQAKTDNTVQVDAIKRRADDYLIKPKVLCESLVEHIRYVIQRKKGIEALRHNCEYFRSIVENAPCAIICISPYGQILEFNACARHLWKKDRQEITGKSFLQTCVERGERFNVYVNLRKALAGEPVNGATTKITTAQGRSDLLHWDFSPIRTEAGSIDSVIAIARRSTVAEVKIDNRLSALRLAFNPRFNDAVENILTSLAAILEKIDKLNSRAEPDTLKELADNMLSVNCRDEQIRSRKAPAIERLVLSLITGGQDTNPIP